MWLGPNIMPLGSPHPGVPESSVLPTEAGGSSSDVGGTSVLSAEAPSAVPEPAAEQVQTSPGSAPVSLPTQIGPVSDQNPVEASSGVPDGNAPEAPAQPS